MRALACTTAALVVLGAASCLPDPAKKAEVDVSVHAGPREFQTADGYALRFTRRVAIISVGTTSTSGSGGNSAPQIRDLDAPPFTYPQSRALGERFVSVHTQSFYEKQPRGPNISEADIDVLDGEGSDADGVRRRGAVSFLVRGVIVRNGETWTFDWRGSPFVSAVCGRLTEAGLAPIEFETESHHAIDVEVRIERMFARSGEPDTLLVGGFVDADANGDHVLTAAELAKGASAHDGFDSLLRIFEVKLNGVSLTCRLPSDVLQGFF